MTADQGCSDSILQCRKNTPLMVDGNWVSSISLSPRWHKRPLLQYHVSDPHIAVDSKHSVVYCGKKVSWASRYLRRIRSLSKAEYVSDSWSCIPVEVNSRVYCNWEEDPTISWIRRDTYTMLPSENGLYMSFEQKRIPGDIAANHKWVNFWESR